MSEAVGVPEDALPSPAQTSCRCEAIGYCPRACRAHLARSPVIDAETPLPVLVFDVGGATSVAALVRDGRFLERRRMLTRRGGGPGAWLDAAGEVATAWRGRFRRAAIVETDDAATGEVASAMTHRLGFPVTALPEAQAAAWSEHRFGAAPGAEMVFLWAGRSIAGAVISGGTLLRGAHGRAGQLGRLRVDGGRTTINEIAGGAALMRRATAQGVRDLPALLAAASAGSRWAVVLLEDAAAALASAMEAVQLLLDPPVIVLGGAIGSAPGFIDRLQGRLAEVSPRPTLQAATLGPEAALLGAADHATTQAGVLALTAA